MGEKIRALQARVDELEAENERLRKVVERYREAERKEAEWREHRNRLGYMNP